MIVDEIKVSLKAGDGGQGSSCTEHLSSRKITGGGGNGGRGGNIIIRQNPHLYDLKSFRERKKFVAGDGESGKSGNKDGKNAKDIFVDVPKGTIVRDVADGSVIVDIDSDDQECLICKGGQGGEGNYRRDYTIPAGEGEARNVILDYRIPNDIIILGFANSGKSSLFNVLTGKASKVADYPYATTHCIWAVSESNGERIVIMDTPPLKREKDKAYTNKWLKHLYRTKIILLVSDNSKEAKSEFSLIESIIALFDKAFLEDKKVFYLLNKIDTIDTTLNIKDIDLVSAKTGQGINELLGKLKV